MSTAAQGCMDTFSLCLVVSDQFEAATCVPQKLVNQTLYTACECYRNVNRDTPPTNTAGTAGAPVAGTANTPAKAAAAGVHESGVWMSAMTASLLCLVTAIMV
ncbi:hypothetical protein BDEG_21508 [Batrachochytrium dendrobatidis JEL423]|uniref:Uncharacterized protein n=1 Tax=Batrachochytrium dendrobatidis (strain JEL423) TaxID=403673 RepID=A0A177WBT4_BATDL|nr:hypothetical protein BDEG_21508 [Batrachochytrium dendrobatidis JEL423]